MVALMITVEGLPLGQYMHQHEVTDISRLILKEGDSEDVKQVKGNSINM